jgi:hypothetical protein
MQYPPPNQPPLYSNVQQASQLPLDAAQYAEERAAQQRAEMAPYLGTLAAANEMRWSGQQK